VAAAGDATKPMIPEADEGGANEICVKGGNRDAAAVTSVARWVRALNAAGLNKA
jgi:hypothetical protein